MAPTKGHQRRRCTPFRNEQTMEDVAKTKSAIISRDKPIRDRGWFEGVIRPCVAELVSVTLFVFVGTMSCNLGNNALAIALAHGLAIAILVLCVGGISGGHLNPAVTLGVFLSGAIPPLNAVLYVISQLIGGLLGSAFTLGVLGDDTYKAMNGGAHALSSSVSVGQGLLCETILTSVLVTVVLLSAVDEETKSVLGPLAIGLAVAADIMAGIAVTGGGMNPARSFGPAVMMSSFSSSVWDNHWIYWMGPTLGGLLAAAWYRTILAGQQRRLF